MRACSGGFGMNSEQKQVILESLWPEGAKSRLGVWGILDCARDPKIYLALLESKLEFRCLYSGKLPRSLEMVAPHLVELLPSNRLVHRWLDEGWGQSWGVWLRIDDPSNLRHHLRKLLRVQDETGNRFVFRFYDPRVLRVYLPTCKADELQTVFGPIVSLFAEEAEGVDVVEYRVERSLLKSHRLLGNTAPVV
jgi:hypothetical protein